MKRLSLLVLLALILSLALVACGGGATTETPAEEAVATEAPAEEVATEAPAEEEATGSMDCTDAIGCITVAPGDPIVIASALVISGPNIELGTDSQHGIEIAIAMRPEVLGHPVELQAEDDGCSAEGGQAAGTKIVANPQVVGIIGTS